MLFEVSVTLVGFSKSCEQPRERMESRSFRFVGFLYAVEKSTLKSPKIMTSRFAKSIFGEIFPIYETNTAKSKSGAL